MFRSAFLMDCRRSLAPVKMGIMICLMAVILIFSDWKSLWLEIQDISTAGLQEYHAGIVQLLSSVMVFDKFKLVLVFLLAGIYTNSFCADDTSHYLRMILTRMDVTTYTQSRFLANTLSIVLATIGGFLLATLVLSPVFPLTRLNGEDSSYYLFISKNYPIVYIMMMGLQFGMVTAACCSVALLFSVFQADKFVSIALPGLLFFLAISYIPSDSVFDVLALVSMAPSFFKSFDSSPVVNYLWGMLYPTVIIMLCGYFFYQRLEWRMENGVI